MLVRKNRALRGARGFGFSNSLARAIEHTVESLEARQLLSGATPVFRYQFNEGSGTTVADTGANGANAKNNGTLVGDVIPQWVPGPSGQAGDFALQITNAKNPANTGDPYFKHLVTGAVITAP